MAAGGNFKFKLNVRIGTEGVAVGGQCRESEAPGMQMHTKWSQIVFEVADSDRLGDRENTSSTE